ncbi:hypothetical protein [Mesorhizobium sp. KR2-14]|uniref:hypothetical protein n=1 Tax=Mesorhizobium sp. KR2-14 TaxID=3156610 RepID=UPI0032B378AA
MTDEISSPVLTAVRKDDKVLHFKIVTLYDPEIVSALRKIPNTKWHADLRGWIVPAAHLLVTNRRL